VELLRVVAGVVSCRGKGLEPEKRPYSLATGTPWPGADRLVGRFLYEVPDACPQRGTRIIALQGRASDASTAAGVAGTPFGQWINRSLSTGCPPTSTLARKLLAARLAWGRLPYPQAEGGEAPGNDDRQVALANRGPIDKVWAGDPRKFDARWHKVLYYAAWWPIVIGFVLQAAAVIVQ
jgi:hypothetical protein